MKMNQKIANGAKKVLLAATLTVGLLAVDSLFNQAQAKEKPVNRLWNGKCCPLCSLGNCGGY